MTFVLKSGSSGNTAEVDDSNRVQAFSTSQTDSTARAINGDSFNINTETVTLTTATASALLYVRNDDTVDWIVPRVFYNAETSTGGTGGWLAEILANPTDGTLIDSGTTITPHNFNFGSPKVLSATTLKGVEGSTVVGDDVRISTIIPASGTRVLIGFDSVVLATGSSLCIRITPPTDNTSMDIQVGLNLHRRV